MRKSFLIYLTCFLQIAFAQSERVEISGRVSVTDKPEQGVFCFKSRLSFSDTLFIETECDTNGNYSFEVSKTLLKNHKTSVYVYQDQNLLKKRFPPSAACPYVYLGPERFLTPRPTTISFEASTERYIVNFELGKTCFLPRTLCFSFKRNSIELCNCGDLNSDTTLMCLKTILESNPTLVVQLDGHSWDEKKPVEISAKRAEYIRMQLIRLGIDSVRVTAMAYGDKQPLVTLKEIQGAGWSKSEEEKTLTRNRRVDFKIIAFDYDPKTRTRDSDTKKQSNENDD